MYNVLLAGVGGQGTVLASKIIASCAMKKGETAHTAETIGMAQRGGSVVSHVRVGENCFSPLIPKGTADVIIGFEPGEAVRVLPYLKNGGAVIVSSAAVKPVTDSLSDSGYDGNKMLQYLKDKNIDVTVVDGEKITDELGSAKSLNIALLGAAAKKGIIDISVDDIKEYIKTSLKPQFCEINLKALNFGASFV